MINCGRHRAVPSKDKARVIIRGLKNAGIEVIASLPDGALVSMIEVIDENNDFIHVPLTREEEGVGVCAGAYFAGARTALLVQNAGLLNSCNGLTTTGLQFGIPMLLVVLYAGANGDMAFPQLGQVTEPVLSALKIPYYILDDLTDSSMLFGKAMTQAFFSTSRSCENV
jgi:sulfopyruvate decarboxylase subunit alpha